MIFPKLRRLGKAHAPTPGNEGALLNAVHRQLALARDVLSSNAALTDILREAEQRAGAQGLAQVTQRLTLTSQTMLAHNAELIAVIEATASAMNDFTNSVSAFEQRFRQLEEYVGSTRKSTGDIVKLVMHSRMLSLNARIEAARLGDAGAGFGVVAEEMGELSQRTEELSNGITDNMTGMLSALQATSEEFTRNRAALAAAGSVVTTLRESSTRIREETESVVSASGEVEQIAFNQVELQEYLESIERHAGWVRESATTLATELEGSRTEVEQAWRAALPQKSAHLPDALEQFEAAIYEAVVSDTPEAAVAAVRVAARAGLPGDALLDRLGAASMRVALDQASEEPPTEVYFRNGDVLQHAMEALEPILKTSGSGGDKGVVVLGNAFEDYHDLGRRLVSIALRAAGFHVVDLGLSVSNERFVAAAREHHADVVGVSTLLLHTAKWIPRLREDLARAGLGRIPIVAGGAPFLVDPQLGERFQVDGVGRSPSDAVRLVRSLVAGQRGGTQQ